MKKHIEHHKDGSVWAKGQSQNGRMEGPWVWFRKDGSKMRSGNFKKGEQVGVWTTYDAAGKVYKKTVMKPKVREFPEYLSAPAQRALLCIGIKTLKQLSKVTEKDLLQLHGIGPSSIPLLKKDLKKNKLTFRKE